MTTYIARFNPVGAPRLLTRDQAAFNYPHLQLLLSASSRGKNLNRKNLL